MFTHEIDKSEVRADVVKLTHIRETVHVPAVIYERASVLIGNYIGDENRQGKPYLTPTVEALVYLSHAISHPHGKNRLLAVARRQLADDLPEHLALLKHALVIADKTEDEYHLGITEHVRMRVHLNKSNGVIWMAPGATTEKDGLHLPIRTGSIQLAVSHDAELGVVAMETEGKGEERVVRSLHIEHIPLPRITADRKTSDTKKWLRLVNLSIGRYALARSVLLLPKEQEHGDYRDPDAEMEIAISSLRGMERHGVFVTGGFMG